MRSGRGFTLFETIIVIGLLSLVAVGIKTIQPRIHEAQNSGRDEYVGLQLAQGCAERLLLVRRKLGYANVTTTTCNGMGGLGGFAADPVVALRDASNTVISACATATCTASITVARTAGPFNAPAALTLQLSEY